MACFRPCRSPKLRADAEGELTTCGRRALCPGQEGGLEPHRLQHGPHRRLHRHRQQRGDDEQERQRDAHDDRLLKAHQQAEHWDEALLVLEQLERRDAIDSTTASLLRQHAFLAGLARQHDLPTLLTYWKTLPLEFRRRSKLAAAAADALLTMGADEQAASLLADSLDNQWDSELISLYGRCRSSDVLKQIERAEIWLKRHKDDAALLLTLGKLCTYQQLWGKAKTYLDASIGIAPSAAAYTALGQLAEKLGDPPARYYQRAADLSTRAS